MKRNRVSDADFDEVSTVDVPANQHGLIVLTKRAAPEETQMQYYDLDGDPVDLDQVEPGTVLQDENQNLVETYDPSDELDEDVYDGADERELESVGKSAFFQNLAQGEDAVFAALSEELSKAATDADREQVLAKAFALQSTELSKAQAQATEAIELAKALQNQQEQVAYIAKAAEYVTPVDPEVLGPVLQRMSKAMSYADCAVIAQVLETPGDIFKSYGLEGEATMFDPFDEIEAHANGDGTIAKSADGRELLTKEQRTAAFFDEHPEEYRAYRASRNGA